MDAANPPERPPRAWRGKGLARVSLLLVVGALVAALAAAFGIARDYGYLQASMLTGSPAASIMRWPPVSPSAPRASTGASRRSRPQARSRMSTASPPAEDAAPKCSP